jgi:hypothetical protein
MNDLAKEIRSSTGLNLDEFCQSYMSCNRQAFYIKVKNNRFPPNEALLLCLLTGKNPKQLFGLSVFETFFLNGKDEINKQIKAILADPGNMQKLALIISEDNGLKIDLTNAMTKPEAKPEKKIRKQRAPKPSPVKQSITPEVKENKKVYTTIEDMMKAPESTDATPANFDFVENIFSK